ncbi:patatin-like phospholipase domain-containing protein 4 [Elysia marginata]|uniref:Patatin-like phospholipase domain-containing protein 4 n=1 Tax=Elysia marginata TaxID=1093978 RepID=A0AAV4K1N3_9GAST|nr:patatin-like phospholipase domain-containing protein 4 [Elysia marginata]
MMMLHRSASESAFSRTHRTHTPNGLERQDSSNTEDGGLVLIATPSARTLPRREEAVACAPMNRLDLRHRRPRLAWLGASRENRLPAPVRTFSKTAWASEKSVDTADGRRILKKAAKSSKRQLVLPPSSSDEDEDEYEPICFARKDSSSSVKPSNQTPSKSFARSPSGSSNTKGGQDGSRSPGVHPGSPKRLTSQNRYHPHNEKFPIPDSPKTCKPSSAKNSDALRDDVFDYSPPSKTSPAKKYAPSSRDKRILSNEESTPAHSRGRKPSREVLLEFPSASNTTARPLGRVGQQTERVKEDRREQVQISNTPSRQVIRTAQSVPRLDTEGMTTPTNSPDRSTRPRSVVDNRERQRHKSNRGKMCDFFFFFRWGKKKDRQPPSEEDDIQDDNSRSRSKGKSSRHYSKSGDSASPSGSRDKHSRGRSRSRSKDKKAVSSSDRQHRSSHHQTREDRHHSQHHRPSSSSTSRPLRTPTTGGQASEPQYRQYRHHHRREQQHHKKQHHSPDENRPPPQQYTPSRQKRERPKKHQHRRGRNSSKPSRDDARSHLSDGTVGLRHEDLPLHPSIAKAVSPNAQKTPKDKAAPVTGSYQKNTFVRAPGTGGDQLRRGWKRSRSESPSNLRPSTGNSGSNTNIAGDSSNGGGEGGGGLKERSMHSASRTDLDSNFHYTESSTDQRRNSGPPSTSMNRSRSYPGFESSRNMHYYNPDADTKVINDAEDFEFKPTDMTGPLHLSFCGCGFVGMYHLGVVSCLLARGETFLERVEKVAGSSAGALMAAVMLCAPDKIESRGKARPG